MASTIGFKRAKFFIYDKADKVVKTHVVEGKANQGGTVEASISGLSAESVKVYASNVAYYVAQRGTGSVELSLSVLDMTPELTADLLGRKQNEAGITILGADTEPPYAGVLLEASTLTNEPIFFALLKGKFRLDEQALSTNEEELSELYLLSAIRTCAIRQPNLRLLPYCQQIARWSWNCSKWSKRL